MNTAARWRTGHGSSSRSSRALVAPRTCWSASASHPSDSACGSGRSALDLGVDFVLPGRASVLHHDLARRIIEDPDFVATRPPVTSAYLMGEGLSAVFVEYMRNWAGFVVDPE